VSDGQIRAQTSNRTQVDDGFVGLSLLQQQLSKRILRVGIARTCLDCGLKRGFCLLRIAVIARVQATLIGVWTRRGGVLPTGNGHEKGDCDRD